MKNGPAVAMAVLVAAGATNRSENAMLFPASLVGKGVVVQKRLVLVTGHRVMDLIG